MKLYTFEEFLLEKTHNTAFDLILEGGAAGHMAHPFNDGSLTFGDFKKLIEAGLSGELNFEEDATEKTDGQNLFITIKDGDVLFARNAGDLSYPMNLNGIKDKFKGHASAMVEETFTLAAEDLASQLMKLSKDVQDATFENGLNWMNMELIYSKNPNVIYYDRDLIQFHGIKKTDGKGNIIGEDNKPASALVKALEAVKANIGKTFTIIPPQIIKLGKDLNFEENKSKFLKKVEDLKSKYNLSDADEVSRYHEMWWREQIEAAFGDLTSDIKEGLLMRWAFEDKKTLNMRALAKEVTPEQMEAIRQFDKVDSKKKHKENIRPFEDLFLELGSIILKNASNFVAANPDAEAQRLHAHLRAEADKIKKGGSVEQIAKVEAELARLDRIGGIESIVPTEGIVFVYKGKTFKLTGTFAAINQLMGIIRFGR